MYVLSGPGKTTIGKPYILHFVLGKRKISLDQLRKGLETFGDLDQVKVNSELYKPLFTATETYDNEKLLSLLKFNDNDDSKCIENMKTYIIDASQKNNRSL